MGLRTGSSVFMVGAVTLGVGTATCDAVQAASRWELGDWLRGAGTCGRLPSMASVVCWCRCRCLPYLQAYGASGTGKSYTMQGTAAQPGMIPRTLSRLYQASQRL